MAIDKGIFGNRSSFDDRYIKNYQHLAEVVKHCRGLGMGIVLTSGSFDLIHEGHALYLEEAKKRGDLLIVGVDSDEKIRRRKGPDRPIVPEDERLRMLTHLRSPDIVFLKEVEHEKW